MWQAIADGQFNRATLLWVANTAAAVLAADECEASKRAGEVLKAAGLSDKYNPRKEAICTAVGDADFTAALIERGNRWCPARALRRGERTRLRREAVERAGIGGDGEAGVSDKDIENALKG